MLAELERPPKTIDRPARFRRHVVGAAAGVMMILLGIAAVLFWPDAPPRTNVSFVTEAPYFEATIYLDGHRLDKPDGTPYTTPCTVENLPASVHHVVFRRSGLPELPAGEIDFAETHQIVARWPVESSP